MLGIEQETHKTAERERERERKGCSGSGFRKRLLQVVVWCKTTLNESLIFFKRLKGLTERLEGCCIYDQVTEVRNGSQVRSRVKWKKKRLSSFNFTGGINSDCTGGYVQ